MKFLKLTFLIALIAGFGLFSSCKPGPDPEPSIEEAQLKKLVKTWVLDGATLAGVDKDADYPNFKITITGIFSPTSAGPYGYEVIGNTPADYPTLSPWPTDKDGEWIFNDAAPQTQIIRDEGTPQELIIDYTVTATSLQLIFTYTRDGTNGRISSVNGTWIMNFIPE